MDNILTRLRFFDRKKSYCHKFSERGKIFLLFSPFFSRDGEENRRKLTVAAAKNRNPKLINSENTKNQAEKYNLPNWSFFALSAFQVNFSTDQQTDDKHFSYVNVL